MSSFSLSRRSLIKAAALAGGAVAFGLPQALWPSAAEAYSVPSKMAWWYQARFGMFIHFGSYSYLGHGEWAFSTENYTKSGWQTQVSPHFNPAGFNADTIADLALKAGMKYLVITAKHHEGFAMYDSDVASFTDTTGTKQYNLHDYTAYQSDLLAALKSACEARGIKFGLYYSIMDWNHSSQTINRNTNYSDMASMSARSAYITDMKAQLQELLTKYDPAILWFDGDWCGNPSTPTLTDWWTQSDGADLYNWLISRKPSLVVNERVKRDVGLGDFACPEQTVPAAPLSRPWETCATMNGAWGYNAGAENSYRSVKAIVQEFVTVVSRDGNYLLNIGPKGDGTPTPGSVAILQGLASWMTTYSDSVHGTTASPFTAEPSWGKFTKKDGRLFAHVFTWPTSGTLQIPLIHNTVNRVYLMNNPTASLSYTVSGGNINVSIPTTAPNANDSVVVVEVTGVPAPVAGANYRIVNRNSGKSLAIAGNSTADGAVAVQTTGGGAWTIDAAPSGTYKLTCVSSGKVLDVNGYSSTAGLQLQQWTSNGGTNQQWYLQTTGDGYFTIVSHDSGLVADDYGWDTSDGAKVVQWNASGGANQQWQLVPA
ncbi:alpha-L-fucosidase [Streptomyces guryensis]|uniref:alpha-L-fucosidase n=1 Tax=Streptomyces guryensis TaxID=2886947 RepID=A0A9Q3VXH1_9ACTN|nr:alpha-L-fucosidase [Streptomyces guryensis]MCD9879952.1 alpha-L-fucosidase [Streptomyces guryensis]